MHFLAICATLISGTKEPSLANRRRHEWRKSMKRQIIQIGFGTLLTLVLYTGCYSHRAHQPVVATSPTGTVVVTEAPPAVKHEVVGVSPGTDYVWVRGYWLRNGPNWVWMPGHYERRPRSGVTWVQGHWDRTSPGWVWTPGHWE